MKIRSLLALGTATLTLGGVVAIPAASASSHARPTTEHQPKAITATHLTTAHGQDSAAATHVTTVHKHQPTDTTHFKAVRKQKSTATELSPAETQRLAASTTKNGGGDPNCCG